MKENSNIILPLPTENAIFFKQYRSLTCLVQYYIAYHILNTMLLPIGHYISWKFFYKKRQKDIFPFN